MRRLHCLIKREQAGYWAAFCLDFTLYAVGDTADEAKAKLLEHIAEFVRDAEAEPAYGRHLLNRKAPFWDWVMFYLLSGLRSLRLDFSEATFTPPYRRA
jgi:predicted RNase H-like HicB family nuclease